MSNKSLLKTSAFKGFQTHLPHALVGPSDQEARNSVLPKLAEGANTNQERLELEGNHSLVSFVNT